MSYASDTLNLKPENEMLHLVDTTKTYIPHNIHPCRRKEPPEKMQRLYKASFLQSLHKLQKILVVFLSVFFFVCDVSKRFRCVQVYENGFENCGSPESWVLLHILTKCDGFDQ